MQKILYHNILSQMQAFYDTFYTKPKRGRKPKISLPQIATLFLMSYITNAPVLTLARLFISPSIRSYQIFRKAKIKQVYRFLRDFLLWKTTMLILLKTLSGKKLRLVVDGTILPVANVNRARTHRIKRFAGRVFWAKRKRNIYSPHYKRRVKWEELYYGVLVMVLCDETGVVYDIWFKPGNWHEVRAYEERKRRSSWFRYLVSSSEVYGDRGYRGVDGVLICDAKEDKALRQVVEGVIGAVKGFNFVSRWRKGITLLSYLYAYAIGYSFFRRAYVWS